MVRKRHRLEDFTVRAKPFLSRHIDFFLLLIHATQVDTNRHTTLTCGSCIHVVPHACNICAWPHVNHISEVCRSHAFHTVVVLILPSANHAFCELLPSSTFVLELCNGSLALWTSVLDLLDPLTNTHQAVSVAAAVE